MTMKLTPLLIDDRRDGMASISKSDGECITGWLNEHHAEEIVRAVNLHVDLVATLKAIADPTVRIDGVFAQFAIERFQSLAHGALSQVKDAK